MTNELDQMNPYDRLDPIHQLAIKLRLEFFKYKYIAEKLNRSESSIEKWFAVGGECHEGLKFMEQKRKEESTEMFKKVREELEALTPEAIIVLRKALTRGDAKTAIEVLAINGIVAKNTLEIDFKNKEKVDAFGKVLDQLQNGKKSTTGKDENPPSAV